MSDEVYVLLDLINENNAQIGRILRWKLGVAAVDMLEGPPDLIMCIALIY